MLTTVQMVSKNEMRLGNVPPAHIVTTEIFTVSTRFHRQGRYPDLLNQRRTSLEFRSEDELLGAMILLYKNAGSSVSPP